MFGRHVLALAAFAAFASCREPTEITLEITTDVPCDAVADVAISLGTTSAQIESGPVTLETTVCDSSRQRIGTLVLVPKNVADDAVAIKVTARVKQPGDTATGPCVAPYGPSCIVARRAIRYIAHTPLHLPIELSRSCEGLPCTPDQTCDHGACRPTVECGTNGCSRADGGAPVPVVQGCGDMTALQAGAPWPMFGYCPPRLGRSPFAGPHAASPKVTSRGVLTAPGVTTSPLIAADGTVIVANNSEIVGVHPDLGPSWTANGAAITGSLGDVSIDRSGVIDSRGVLWMLSSDGAVFAVSVANGATQRIDNKYTIRAPFGAPSILPDHTIVFVVDSGMTVVGLDPITGAERWRTPAPNWPMITNGALDAEGTMFFGSVDDRLVGITAGGQGALWSNYTNTSTVSFENVTAHPGGFIWAPVQDGVYVFDPHVMDGAGAGELVPVAPGVSNGLAVGPAGTLYAGTTAGTLYAIDATTRTTKVFGTAIPTEVARTPIVGADGVVYVAVGPALYAFDPSGKQLFSVASAQAQDFDTAGAIAADGTLYVADANGTLYAIHD